MLSNRQLLFCYFLVACPLTLPGWGETIHSVAGNGAAENTGDEGRATEIGIKDPFGVEVGPDGALYITEVGHHRIRRVQSGRITTIAGTGSKGYSGDGGAATKATLNEPYEVRFDSAGNMIFVEMQNHLIRRVERGSRKISTVAGTGTAGFSGDGGRATKASFRRPHSIALDKDNNIYVADIGNHRIRRVDASSGIVETIAGNGEPRLPKNNAVAKDSPLQGPRALYITGATMWIALREGHSVWKLDLSSGRLQHVAGSGKKGFRDGGPDQATFNGPKGIVVDNRNNVFVVDTENHVIRRIDGTTRQVSTVAGSGQRGFAGDDGPALQAAMNRPHGICLDDRSMFIGDTLNHRVRRVQLTSP